MDMRLATVLARELCGYPTGRRDCTALEAMSVATQIKAMRDGGRAEGRTAAGYLFHSTQISSMISAEQQIIDLGCGTGEQLLQVAEINPQTRFVGIDRAQEMLDAAAARAQELRLTNVEFMCADVTDLGAVASHGFHGVMSTMTLHHFPDVYSVAACFEEISRLLRPDGFVYIEDFGRLKLEATIKYFVRRADEGMPDAFSNLYGASLRAAFKVHELREVAAAHLPATVQFFRTIPIPFLVVLATPGRRRLSAVQSAGLRTLYGNLDAKRREDYHELRLAFRFGGLRDVKPWNSS